MKKGISCAVVGGLLLSAGGCSWFGGEKNQDVTQPISSNSVYTPPLKTDRNRTGDFRRDGLLGNSDSQTRVSATTARPVGGTASPSASSAQPEYVVLGSVVANVNGTPIYGHELIKQVAPLLRAQAKELEPTPFKQVAFKALKDQRDVLVQDELVYAAAQRNTTDEEKGFATAATFMYRERLITQAGGSLEMARSLAREQGEDFDRLLRREERRQLARIYYQKRILPRVVITVDEMRRYYEQRRNTLFTVTPKATVRIIRVDMKDAGGEAAALGQINEARRRAANGEDFATLSDTFNKLPLLVQNKGLFGPFSKGSYAIEEVEEAVWQTEQGRITPVIRTPTAFFIAQVVEKNEGRVKGFEEQEVQQAIRSAIQESQMLELQRRQITMLEQDAVIVRDDALLTPIIEMALQLYPEWRAGTR